VSAPLAGIRVLDLSRFLAGPYCTMTLADLGAEVWKIEHPAGGDDTRAWRPPEAGGESTYYFSINRSKRSLAIDLKVPSGLAAVKALAARADVLIANFLPDALHRFGLEYAALAPDNPRLVHCTVTGYGAVGMRSSHAGYDFVIQGESGLMAITGVPDGQPVKFGVAIADLLAGMNASQAILAALYAREKLGCGQAIDISLLDGALAVLINVGAGVLNAGAGDERYGNAHASVVPYQTFVTADGAIVLACGNDRQFRLLCGPVLERPALAADGRFATNRARVEHRTILIPLLAEIVRAIPTARLLAALRAAGVPAGEIRSVPAALAAPEVVERGMIATVSHPQAGTLRLVGSPLHLAMTPPVPPQPPPLLGEHTRSVLHDVLGLDEQALDRLERDGAFGASARAAG
jgi:crotonobetainyl-CoA:carnitine CoA-transferase CaiB-like acyl-CoA transferase